MKARFLDNNVRRLPSDTTATCRRITFEFDLGRAALIGRRAIRCRHPHWGAAEFEPNCTAVGRLESTGLRIAAVLGEGWGARGASRLNTP